MRAGPLTKSTFRRYCAMAVAAIVVLVQPAVGVAEPLLQAGLDSSVVTLGEPIHLRLVVERDASSRVVFPQLEDELGELTVRAQSTVRTTKTSDDGRRDERVYELAAYTLEVDEVPAPSVLVIRARGDTVALHAASLPLEVVAVRGDDEGEDLRAIKPPVWISGGIPLWLAGIFAAVVAIGLAWLGSRILRRRAAVASPAPVSPAAPVDYEREFARIAELGLLERGALKLYYTHLSHVLRCYLEDRLGVEALERTTAEIATDLAARRAPPDAEAVQRIIAFLQAADMVKFARAEPPATEARMAPETGRRLVAEVDEQLRPAAAATTPAAPPPPPVAAVEA